ncbi:hypothetical protein FJV76_00540 [Mesorhizobium sp. WSM4303]|uniref:hypothetical protein n=1 Tax=unclassified Mesorhizobium TaxID=325217 RepID=UPI00115E585F|nr:MULTISPECIES: hypothetical protein [unclassified Mesorhizobium]TRC97495.1 hypothetical protein FJV77_10195 [Mesorhizobium sp. WSM4306]TRD08806.1 hypothetical protein FJV76_00540 [Mesorhizobium sp. WSM4303]
MHIELTNEVAFGEPPPSVVVSCTLREVRELSSKLLLQNILDVSSGFNATFSGGISSFQVAVSEGNEHLIKIEDGKASISLSREKSRAISEMLNGFDSPGQTIYVDFDGLDLFEEANLIIYTI